MLFVSETADAREVFGFRGRRFPAHRPGTRARGRALAQVAPGSQCHADTSAGRSHSGKLRSARTSIARLQILVKHNRPMLDITPLVVACPAARTTGRHARMAL